VGTSKLALQAHGRAEASVAESATALGALESGQLNLAEAAALTGFIVR
jgi:hypothetical protein